MYCDSVNLRSATCVTDFTAFVDITDDISQMPEHGTRGQSANANWVNARNNLITASVIGEGYIRKKFSLTIVEKTVWICDYSR
jgi:hypothetical protein